jgi:hypothetical protein
VTDSSLDRVPHIGTLAERSLHASLKDWYEQPGDQREVKVDGFVIDLVRGDLLIEIQTRSFWSLKRKLTKLTESHRVLLAHPIPAERWIVKYAADGESLIERRKSPKKGYIEQIFSELVSFPTLIEQENFSLEVLLTREEQIWRNDGQGSWRRKGWSVTDRRLLEVMRNVRFNTKEDFCALIPESVLPEFTIKELAKGLKQPIRIANDMTYCLRTMGAIKQVGTKGRAYLYARST